MESLLISGAFLLSIFGQPVYASTEPIPIPIVETIEQIKTEIIEESVRLGVNSATSTDIAFFESSFNPKATNGTDNGLYAFNDITFQEKCIDKYKFAQVLDEKWDYKVQIKCAVKLMADRQYWRWASSRDKWDVEYAGNNCVKSARLKDPTIPFQDASKFIPNTIIPRVGDVLVFKYKNNSHIAIIGKITKNGYQTISEGNYYKGIITSRLVKFDDPKLLGVWTNKKE